VTELGALSEVTAVRALVERIRKRTEERAHDLADERLELRRVHFDGLVGRVERDVILLALARCDRADLPHEKPEGLACTRVTQLRVRQDVVVRSELRPIEVGLVALAHDLGVDDAVGSLFILQQEVVLPAQRERRCFTIDDDRGALEHLSRRVHGARWQRW